MNLEDNPPVISSPLLRSSSSLPLIRRSTRHHFSVLPRKISNVTAPTITIQPVIFVTFSNIIWTILVGWWVSLFFALASLLCFIFIIPYKYGIILFHTSKFIFFPFGSYCYLDNSVSTPSIISRLLFFLALLIFLIPILAGMILSWELIFYIPMCSILWRLLVLLFKSGHEIKFGPLVNGSPSQQVQPQFIVYYSGHFHYFKYSVGHMEVVYLNLFPLILISLYTHFFAPEGHALREPVTGTLISILATIPCMYVIGVCTEILSSRAGLLIGSLINAGTTGLVELILFYFFNQTKFS